MKLLTIPAQLRAKLGLPRNATHAQVNGAVMAVADGAQARRRVAHVDAALDRLEKSLPVDDEAELAAHYPPAGAPLEHEPFDSPEDEAFYRATWPEG